MLRGQPLLGDAVEHAAPKLPAVQALHPLVLDPREAQAAGRARLAPSQPDEIVEEDDARHEVVQGCVPVHDAPRFRARATEEDAAGEADLAGDAVGDGFCADRAGHSGAGVGGWG